MTRLLIFVSGLLLVMGCESRPTDEPDTGAVEPDTVATAEPTTGPLDARIAEALSAAPASITSGAAVMDRAAERGGPMIELRPGTNDWVCMPSIPAAAGEPGFGPMCLDSPSREFFAAMRNREVPAIESIGISYMLQGNVQASATDPFAHGPTPDNQWVEMGPSLMIVTPDTAALAALPGSPVPGPWVMWKGTPYAHVMVPVAGPLGTGGSR
jgi:hypothetical protein